MDSITIRSIVYEIKMYEYILSIARHHKFQSHIAYFEKFLADQKQKIKEAKESLKISK